MAQGKAKYDPLEAAKLGTDAPAQQQAPTFETPKAQAAAAPAPAVPAADLPPPRPRYRLMESKRASVRGQICDFKAGRVFDSAGYDIDNLKAQGLQLELIKE